MIKKYGNHGEVICNKNGNEDKKKAGENPQAIALATIREDNKTLHRRDTVGDGDSPNSLARSIDNNRRHHQSISFPKPLHKNNANVGGNQSIASLTISSQTSSRLNPVNPEESQTATSHIILDRSVALGDGYHKPNSLINHSKQTVGERQLTYSPICRSLNITNRGESQRASSFATNLFPNNSSKPTFSPMIGLKDCRGNNCSSPIQLFTSESETEGQDNTNTPKDSVDSDVEVVESPINKALPKSFSKKSPEEQKWMMETINLNYICHIPKEWNGIIESDSPIDVKTAQLENLQWLTTSLREELSQYYPTKDDVTCDNINHDNIMHQTPFVKKCNAFFGLHREFMNRKQLQEVTEDFCNNWNIQVHQQSRSCTCAYSIPIDQSSKKSVSETENSDFKRNIKCPFVIRYSRVNFIKKYGKILFITE